MKLPLLRPSISDQPIERESVDGRRRRLLVWPEHADESSSKIEELLEEINWSASSLIVSQFSCRVPYSVLV